MVSVTITEKGGKPTVREFDQPEITIGRVQGNDIVLPKSNISKRHARIVKNGSGFVVIDAKSTNGTYINGKRINAPYDLRAGDKIFVGDFTLEVVPKAPEAAPQKAARAPSSPPDMPRGQQPTKELGPVDDDILPDSAWGHDSGLDDDWAGDWGSEQAVLPDEPGPGDSLPPTRSDPSFSRSRNIKEVKGSDAAPGVARRDSSGTATKERREPSAPKGAPKKAHSHSQSQNKRSPQPMVDEPSQALRVVHERLLRSLDLRRIDVQRMGDAELRARTLASVKEIVAAMEAAGELPGSVDPAVLIDNVLNEALGLGPLEELLHDSTVTEILVNSARQIFVERRGRLEKTDRTFSSDQAVLGVIERIVAPLGRRIDESSPMVDARLKDGSRVNAIIPPLALSGPTLTIRKFTREPLQIDDLVAGGTLNASMAEFLETCVRARKNVVISGGTGSGKTTTLNVLSSFIDADERIITIEDAAELKLDQQHVVALESRPPNIEGRGAVTIRDLVRNALRMRPDRIIIGECRGGEALDMLQAMNTGHDGSLTTVHANGPRDALSRLETMVLMSGMELPVRAIRDQIASAVDIIVQQARFPDGSRRITHISEITGTEGDVITMQDIFVFQQQGFGADGRVQGKFTATGFVPQFYENLRAAGINADLSIFNDA